jgi:HK97 family phage portal protein
MPNDDAQMLQTRQFQIPEIGRFFGVPPFLLMDTEKSTSWGTGLEQQAQGWVTFDLHPTWLAPTEQRVTKELTAAGIYASYDVTSLLRGDSEARANYYQTMRTVGALNVNEIRERENLEPIPGPAGNNYAQPLNGPVAGGGVPLPSGPKTPQKPDLDQDQLPSTNGRVGAAH